MQQLQTQFISMDEDGSGAIDIGELGRAMERLGKPKNQLQLKKMIEEVDNDKDGEISYLEFLQMMLGKQSSVLRLILMFENKAKAETDSMQVSKKAGQAPARKTWQELP